MQVPALGRGLAPEQDMDPAEDSHPVRDRTAVRMERCRSLAGAGTAVGAAAAAGAGTAAGVDTAAGAGTAAAGQRTEGLVRDLQQEQELLLPDSCFQPDCYKVRAATVMQPVLKTRLDCKPCRPYRKSYRGRTEAG